MYPTRCAPRVLAENKNILLVLYGDNCLSTDLELIAVGALWGPLHKQAQCPVRLSSKLICAEMPSCQKI